VNFLSVDMFDAAAVSKSRLFFVCNWYENQLLYATLHTKDYEKV
jgi:hypothetical protein